MRLCLFILATFFKVSQPTPLNADKLLDQSYTSCGQIKDCFNCVLNTCSWNTQSNMCLANFNAPSPTTFTNLLLNGQTCGDPLNLCSQHSVRKSCSLEDENCKHAYEGFNRTLFEYSPKGVGTKIPKGYFCMFR